MAKILPSSTPPKNSHVLWRILHDARVDQSNSRLTRIVNHSPSRATLLPVAFASPFSTKYMWKGMSSETIASSRTTKGKSSREKIVQAMSFFNWNRYRTEPVDKHLQFVAFLQLNSLTKKECYFDFFPKRIASQERFRKEVQFCVKLS